MLEAYRCGKTKKGYFKVKRRISRKKLGAALDAFTDWERKARHELRKGEMLRRAKTRVEAHLSYYAITDNGQACSTFVYPCYAHPAQSAQPQEPAQGLQLGRLQPSPGCGGLAPGPVSSKTSTPVAERKLAE